MCQISSWWVYSVAVERQKASNFAAFLTGVFGVANWRHTEKVESDAQLQTLSKGIKIVSVLQRL